MSAPQGGKRYTISGDTPIYTANSEESKSYAEGYGTLTAGSRITLFTQRGKVTAIYAGSTSTAASEDAVVVVDGAQRRRLPQAHRRGRGIHHPEKPAGHQYVSDQAL